MLTEEQKKYVRENAKNMTRSQMETALGVTDFSVKNFLYKSRIRSKKCSPSLSEKDLELISKRWRHATDIEMAEILGCTMTTVFKARMTLGLIRSNHPNKKPNPKPAQKKKPESDEIQIKNSKPTGKVLIRLDEKTEMYCLPDQIEEKKRKWAAYKKKQQSWIK